MLIFWKVSEPWTLVW